VISNLLGTDPAGGTVDSLLGTNNAVSQSLGTPDSSNQAGLVPHTLNTLATESSAPLIGNGLGITGTGGLVYDLIDPDHNDIGTQTVGTSGVIPATIAGGQDGLLGSLVGGPDSNPLLPAAGEALARLPLDKITGNIKPLGITGENGLDQRLQGTDMLGNLLGMQGQATAPLAGGSNGTLGGTLPNGNPPLAALANSANSALGAAAGTSPSPVQGVLGGNLLNGASGVAGNLPAVGSVFQNVANTAGNLPVVGGLTGGSGGSAGAGLGNVLGNITSIINKAPVVGAIVSNVTGGLTGANGGSGGAGLGNVLSTVTGVTNKVPLAGAIVSSVTSGLTGASNGGSGSASLGNVLGAVTSVTNKAPVAGGIVSSVTSSLTGGNQPAGLLGGLLRK
jgi:hypothetical protein